MTTGPRPTPHPIILHVDANGNPVRLAEASAIYATNVSAVTLIATTVSAANYEGLESLGGFPGGPTFAIQYKAADGNFGGESVLNYNPTTNTLAAQNIYVGNLSSIVAASFDDVKAASLSSTTLDSITLNTNTVNSTDVRAITLSATTVCAVNYDAQFNALSFQNLDTRYLNSSGDSVTGSFSVQSLSATTISATTYLNLPSSLAIWNASSIQGRAVTSTAPSLGESLVWLGAAWGPSAVAGGAGGSPGDPNLSIQFKNGAFFSGTENVKYNQSINGIQSVGLSSTNLISVNISGSVVSATTYLNLGEDQPIWNASKIQDFEVLKTFPQEGDILVVNGAIDSWVTKSPSEYADYIYPVIQNRIPSAVAIWNASAIQGRAVTSTPPLANNVLIYNGSVWTPSSSIALGTVTANNLGGTDIVGTRANITSISAITVSANNVIVNSLSSLNISSTSARIVGLSATTISATNWLGLPSAVAIWNASSINGIQVLQPDNSVTGNDVGVLFYARPTNLYYTLPFSSTALAGSRDILTEPYQGQVVASYLGSASPEFQINPIWNTNGIKDLPENNDVLVYKSNLYNYNLGSAWTWAQPSTIIPPTTAAGLASGLIQFRGNNGEFNSDSRLYYDPGFNSLNVVSGAIFLAAPTNPTYISNQSMEVNSLRVLGAATSPFVSAISYNIFGKNTSTTNSVTRQNQSIVYASGTGFEVWKPGYAVYQATGTPSNSTGEDGDIYFQYLP